MPSSSRAELRAAMGAGEKRFDDTLSREISCRNAARTIRVGDFSTLWRLCIESPSQPKLASSLHNKRLSYWRLTGFRRNDGGRGPAFLKSAAKPPPPPFEPSEPYEPSYNMFGRGRLEDLSLLDLSPLQHEHAFGIMVIGAIEDIPLNPV